MALHKFTNEKEWLAARKKFNDITSTELAALMGMSDYKSRLKLWMIKAGKMEDDFVETRYTKWGKRLQLAIGQGIAEDEGWECFDLTNYYIRDEAARIGASMDFKVIRPDRVAGLLETKSTGFFDESSGWFKDRAPIDYEFQIQGQTNLAIAEGQGIEFGVIGALDGRKETKIYPRIADTALWELIKEETAKFWHSIKIDEPPAPDYAVDADLIRKMQGPVNVGQNISLTGNNRAHELIEFYQTLQDNGAVSRMNIADTEKMQAEIKAELHHMVGNAETVLIGDFRINCRETEIDTRLQQGYKYRRFDIKKLNRKNCRRVIFSPLSEAAKKQTKNPKNPPPKI